MVLGRCVIEVNCKGIQKYGSYILCWHIESWFWHLLVTKYFTVVVKRAARISAFWKQRNLSMSGENQGRVTIIRYWSCFLWRTTAILTAPDTARRIRSPLNCDIYFFPKIYASQVTLILLPPPLPNGNVQQLLNDVLSHRRFRRRWPTVVSPPSQGRLPLLFASFYHTISPLQDYKYNLCSRT
jgi:hypothetical protein